MPNRLATEHSPYLLQHANNPVDWYPWGDAAFARAKSEDKPIFLSIGYSTCHWCHVMEHESFENASIAAVLNKDFVSIKLDREERPDVDRVYMMFVQATTGAGGWPMSVWLTPDLKPFFGGTYFPPTARWGRPGFLEVLTQLAQGWHDDKARIVESAQDVVDRLRHATGADDAAPDRAPVAGREALDAGIAQFAQAFDTRHGGFGGAPKFPRPSELLFLLQAGALTGNTQARTMALETLHAMAFGGMRDHIGGGFHRYSVDAEWRVPHFEKMLYDQAQLVLAYLEATQASGDPFYATVAEDTLEYVLRDMTSPEGAFYSAEDADSLAPGGDEKREGAFYVWSADELDALLGADAEIVKRRFGVEPGGNALADPQNEFRGLNLLYIEQTIEDIAARTGRTVEAVMAVLGRARKILFEARAERPRPHLDDKILTAWNGLMIAALARAARTVNDPVCRQRFAEAAGRAANVVRKKLWREDDRLLLRRLRGDDAAIEAFCEDYACLIWGLIELFQTTGDAADLQWARQLMDVQTSKFLDTRDGGWFTTTGTDKTVLLRLKEDYDGAEPSAASVTVRNLLVLGHLLGEESYIDRARRSLERYGPHIGRVARVMPLMLSTLVHWLGTSTQIVIAGEATAPGAVDLEGTLALHYLPWAVTVRLPGRHVAERMSGQAPWLAAMAEVDGRAAAYVCRDFTCSAPVTDPADFAAQLNDAAAPRRIIQA